MGRRIGLAVCWALCIPLTLLGWALALVDLGFDGTLGVLICGTASAVTLVWISQEQLGHRDVVPAAAVGAAVVPAVAGLATFSGATGALSLVLCVAAAGAWWLSRRRPRSTAPVGAPSRGRVPAPVAPVRHRPRFDRETLSGLDDAALCRAWRSSFSPTRTARGADLEALAAERRAYLDEMQARHGTGFARWIVTARAAGDPTRHLLTDDPPVHDDPLEHPGPEKPAV